MKHDEIFSIVIEMITFHKDMQNIDGIDCDKLVKVLFNIPEYGFFHSGDSYKIDGTGICVTTKAKKFYFSWYEIWPHLKIMKKQNFLF